MGRPSTLLIETISGIFSDVAFVFVAVVVVVVVVRPFARPSQTATETTNNNKCRLFLVANALTKRNETSKGSKMIVLAFSVFLTRCFSQ